MCISLYLFLYLFTLFPSEILDLLLVYNPASQPALGDAKYFMTPHLETINTFESVLDSWGKGC